MSGTFAEMIAEAQEAAKLVERMRIIAYMKEKEWGHPPTERLIDAIERGEHWRDR